MPCQSGFWIKASFGARINLVYDSDSKFQLYSETFQDDTSKITYQRSLEFFLSIRNCSPITVVSFHHEITTLPNTPHPRPRTRPQPQRSRRRDSAYSCGTFKPLTSVTLTTPIWGSDRSMPNIFSQYGFNCWQRIWREIEMSKIQNWMLGLGYSVRRILVLTWGIRNMLSFCSRMRNELGLISGRSKMVTLGWN